LLIKIAQKNRTDERAGDNLGKSAQLNFKRDIYATTANQLFHLFK